MGNEVTWGETPTIWTPHKYQETSEKFLMERTIGLGKEGGGALLLDPGMGKTAVCLSAIKTLRKLGYIRSALVVAPRRVVQKVWPQEIVRWTNFHGLHMRAVTGNAEDRRRKLSAPADVYVISRDNLDWLARLLRANQHAPPWQIVFFDESTSFKTWKSRRSKAAREVAARTPYRCIMTGTFSTKDLADVFPQIYLLDQGAALGRNVTEFRNRYCYSDGPKNIGKFKVREDMKAAIRIAIEPMCLRLSIQDYLSMPEITYHDLWVDLPPNVESMYRTMEDQLFVALETASRDISNAAALYGCCKQMANGGIYDNGREPWHLHDAKVEAMMEVIDELSGKPALIAYQYEHDIERIQKKIRGIKVIKGGMKEKEFNRVIDQWNDGSLKPRHLAVQPQAMSYGINMQYGEGRDLIWLGLSDSLEIYQQLNARLWRQGVDSRVRIHRVLATGTVDAMNAARIDDRFDVQANLLEALQDYAKRRYETVPLADVPGIAGGRR